MPDSAKRRPVILFAGLLFLHFGACASAPTAPDGTPIERSPADPWEPMNRQFHRTTTAVDKVTFKLLAKGYQKVVPTFIRRGIGNFSQNLRSPLNIINHFLQGKIGDGFEQTGRFILNSTIGLGGLIDVAVTGGHEQKNEDFGQTLAVWGMPSGPYVFVPFLGPSTVRDAIMMPLNFLADPLWHYDNASVRDKVYLVRFIDARARLLSAEIITEGAYDPYITLREAYLQHRKNEIDDGEEAGDEDYYDDLPEPD